MNILAGEALRLRWDADAKDFVPAAATDKGAIFTIQSLDYFTAQAVLGSGPVPAGLHFLVGSCHGSGGRAARVAPKRKGNIRAEHHAEHPEFEP